MQGQLTGKPLTVCIETECAHCRQPLHIELDGELRYQVVEPGADPVIQVPLVDMEKLNEPSITDVF